MIAILTAATDNYSYALKDSIRSVCQAIPREREFCYILATNKEAVANMAKETWESLTAHKMFPILINLDDSHEKYKQKSQLLISELQGALLEKARLLNAEMAWSVESDVLVHPDSFSGLEWVLKCPSPQYDIAVSTYWNGQFLCGRGSQSQPICEDVGLDERKVPAKLRKQIALAKKGISSAEAAKKYNDLVEQARACSPAGNVFALNAKKWRRRGWLDSAYPGAAVLGAVLPTDWCGMGCTLLSKRALHLSDFYGYDGGGTQDLHLCHFKWRQAGLRMGLNVSVPAIHVKTDKNKSVLSRHVPYFDEGGEFEGHLRVRHFQFPIAP